jgi:hypothetical protein
MPFRIDFISDGHEVGGAILEASKLPAGFKLRYFQVPC